MSMIGHRRQAGGTRGTGGEYSRSNSEEGVEDVGSSLGETCGERDSGEDAEELAISLSADGEIEAELTIAEFMISFCGFKESASGTARGSSMAQGSPLVEDTSMCCAVDGLSDATRDSICLLDDVVG